MTTESLPLAQSIKPTQTAELAALVAAYAREVAHRRRRTLIGLAVVLCGVALASWAAEVKLDVLFDNIDNFSSYVAGLFVLDTGDSVITDPVGWFWGLGKWGAQLGDTILMAYVGTLLGAIIGFCLCFFSARNLMKSPWTCAVMRRFLEFGRTVPDIVFALIFVAAFGLGPVPGVLAIAMHTTGALGKLFAEVVENIDMKPVEGVASTGGAWLQQIRFAVLPQVQTNFVSYALLRFEINVRAAGVLGFVGAGGIGETLLVSIRRFYASDVSAILIMLVLTVMTIDYGTEKLRHWLLGTGERA